MSETPNWMREMNDAMKAEVLGQPPTGPREPEPTPPEPEAAITLARKLAFDLQSDADSGDFGRALDDRCDTAFALLAALLHSPKGRDANG